MRDRRDGFTIIEILITLLVAALIAAIGWTAYSRFASDTPKDSVPPKSIPTATEMIDITLIDSSTKQPISSESFVFRSNDGTRCITEPCDSNEKRYEVKSDRNGTIVVPNALIQLDNSIESPRYLPVQFRFVDGVKHYTLTMNNGAVVPIGE